MYLLLALAATLPVLAPFYWPAGGGLDVTGHPIGRDFINVWAAPQLAFGGRLATLFDLQGYHSAIGELFGRTLPFHNWSYPPTALLFYWPFAQVPYGWGLAAFTLATFAALAAAAALAVPPGRRLSMLLLVALSPASLVNAAGGQNGYLTGALFLGGILLLDRRPAIAGMLFGLLTFKPQLGIVLAAALLALGAWRAVASAVVTALTMAAISAALAGLDAWRLFLTVTSAYNGLVLTEFHGFYTAMMASVFAAARHLGASFAQAMTAQAAVALPVVAVCCWAVRATRDPCRRALVLASAAPLVTPYAFTYDLVSLAVAIAWAMHGRLPWRNVYVLGWIVPAAVFALNVSGFPLGPLALLAVLAAAVRDARIVRPIGAIAAPERLAAPGPRPI